jgi:hypothetical protein
MPRAGKFPSTTNRHARWRACETVHSDAVGQLVTYPCAVSVIDMVARVRSEHRLPFAAGSVEKGIP